MNQQSYLSFLHLRGLINEDLLMKWMLVLDTTPQLAAFTILTHSLELFPGTEKVNMISSVAQQHLIVLRNGTGAADIITSGGRLGC